MEIRRIIFTCVIIAALYAVPAQATEDEPLNSGFGKDMFTGEEHPAFTDPSIHDPRQLQEIAPAAGDTAPEGKGQDSLPPETSRKEQSGARKTQDKELPPGTGGTTSILLEE